MRMPLALLAGAFAAAASVCAKLGLQADDALSDTCADPVPRAVAAALCWGGSALVRLAFLAGVIACNVLMWFSFSKALHDSATSVEASVLTTAANFLCSSVCGALVFGERLPPSYCAGMACILAGVTLIHWSTPAASDPDHQD